MRNRKKRVEGCFAESEYLHLKNQAQNAGIPISELIRRLAAGCDIQPKPSEPQIAILKQLSGIARNVNQIAFLANSMQQVSSSDVKSLLKMQDDIWKLVKSL